MRIGLIASMPEECGPLVRRFTEYTKTEIGRFRCWNFDTGNHHVCLIRSGMGVAHAAEAASALISVHQPALMVSFGFGGAVRPGPAIGDLVLATRLFRLENGHFTQLDEPDREFTERARVSLESHGISSAFHIHQGAFITTDRIENKQGLARLLDPDLVNPLLEMETGAVGRVAAGAEIPFMAIRAVSDSADEEFDFSIAEFTDRDLNISIPRVILTIIRKPGIIPQVIRLARNSRMAADNLASGIMTLLDAL